MDSRPFRVLVVSDERAALRRLSVALSAFGYQTQQVADPQQALALLEATPPDFLLVDTRLAGGAALNVCRVVSATDRSHFVYTILMVEDPSLSELSEALEAGVDDFLAQPIVFGELLARLRAGARTIEFERRFREQVSVDPLTGLPGRTSLIEHLKRNLASHRATEAGTCVVIDLDYLGQINQKHGQPAGDTVVKAVASRLVQHCTAGAFVASLGGGRFAVLVPLASETEAVQWADRVRQDLVEMEVTIGEQPLHVTASVGISAAVHRNAGTGQAQIEQAVQALQAAKNSGRNCVARFGEFDEDLRRWAEMAAPGKLFERTVARDIMTPCTLALQRHQTLDQLAPLLQRIPWTALPVSDADGRLLGLVLEENVRGEAGQGGSDSKRVADVMTTDVPVFDERASFDTLKDFFTRDSRSAVVIVSQGCPIGLVTRNNLGALACVLTVDTFAASRSSSDDSQELLVPDLRPLDSISA